MSTKHKKNGPSRPTGGDLVGGSDTSRAIVLAFYVMTFLSGVAALVYEITWARMLGLTFGSTTLAAAAVIAGFMGGMGLGAWLYHLVYDRAKRPLLIYAMLEIGIAVTTAILTRTFYSLPELFSQLSGSFPPGFREKGHTRPYRFHTKGPTRPVRYSGRRARWFRYRSKRNPATKGS